MSEEELPSATGGKAPVMSGSASVWPWSLGLLVVLACMGIGLPLEFAFVLACGWIAYLVRVRCPRSASICCVAPDGACLSGLVRVGIAPVPGLALPRRCAKARPSDADQKRRWHVALDLLDGDRGAADVCRRDRNRGRHASVRLAAGLGRISQFSRLRCERAQRAQSSINLKQIGLALHNYQQTTDRFRPAPPSTDTGSPMHGWQAMILPFIEQTDLHNRIDFQLPWNDVRNTLALSNEAARFSATWHIDQTEDAAGYALSHYAAMSRCSAAARLCETSKTSRMARQTPSRPAKSSITSSPGAIRPTGAISRSGINRSPDGFGSPSPGGANFLFVDGSVRFLKNIIDPKVLKALSTPAGGERVSADEY